MPTYELTVLIKAAIPRTELAQILKRTSNYIFDQGGVIRKINNLGLLPTPYKVSRHGQVHKKANYFIFEFDAGAKSMFSLHDELNRDVDVLKKEIYKKNPEEDTTECNLDAELKPPMERKEVLEMIKTAKDKEERERNRPSKFKHNTGLDFYPFQR